MPCARRHSGAEWVKPHLCPAAGVQPVSLQKTQRAVPPQRLPLTPQHKPHILVSDLSQTKWVNPRKQQRCAPANSFGVVATASSGPSTYWLIRNRLLWTVFVDGLWGASPSGSISLPPESYRPIARGRTARHHRRWWADDARVASGAFARNAHGDGGGCAFRTVFGANGMALMLRSTGVRREEAPQ